VKILRKQKSPPVSWSSFEPIIPRILSMRRDLCEYKCKSGIQSVFVNVSCILKRAQPEVD
jgi:hypothetical protein